LLGVTRNFVIKLLKEHNIIVEEREIKLRELLEADEIFSTGTFKDILPIVKVDNIAIGDGAVGRKTEQGIKLLKSAMR
jgi:branched-subunit amino acid aminotransferase/4-amino-4-deoxychorismate lyase